MKKVIFFVVVFFASTALLAQMLETSRTSNFAQPSRGTKTCVNQTDCTAGFYCQNIQYNYPAVPCGWNTATNTCQLKFAPDAICMCPVICSIACSYGYHILQPGQPGYQSGPGGSVPMNTRCNLKPVAPRRSI